MKGGLGASAMSAAASHILSSQRGGDPSPAPAARRAQSPQMSAEEFFQANAEHLRQRNADLASIAARRRPQRGEERERAAGPVPDYILAKRGTQARGGHHHERRRGLVPAPRGAVAHAPPGEAALSTVVVDRTEAGEGLVDTMAPRQGNNVIRSPGRPAGRLIPYNTGGEEGAGHRGDACDVLSKGQKQKALQSKGWRLAQAGSGPGQRWVSPTRPMKTFVGLDAAYEEAFKAGASNAGPTMQVIQVKQSFGVRRTTGRAHHAVQAHERRPDTSPLPTPLEAANSFNRAWLKSPSDRPWSPHRDALMTSREVEGGAFLQAGGVGGQGGPAGAQRWRVPQVSSRVSVPPKDRWDSSALKDLEYGSLHQQQPPHTKFGGVLSVPVNGPSSPSDFLDEGAMFHSHEHREPAHGPPSSEEGWYGPGAREREREKEGFGYGDSASSGAGMGKFGVAGGGSIKVNPALMHLLN